jgi:centromere protein I
MSDGSGDEGEGSVPSFSSTLNQLSRLIRLLRYDRTQAKVLVDRIAKIGTSQGFSDQQAIEILQLALRGVMHNGKCISSRISLLLLKSIYPANNQQFGEGFVLTIVGALGPADDTVVDANASIPEAQAKDDNSSSASDHDNEDERDRRRQKRRVKIDIGVQAAAIRLLALLLSPPSVASLQFDKHGSKQTEVTHLPLSFLTSKARRTLDRCYDILFHFLDYQTLRPFLCHLLSLLTRRKHVRYHRIVKLMTLRNSAPDDSHLEAFITTCSKYYPDLLLANAAHPPERASAHAGGIKYPDMKWLFQVQSIWSRSEPYSGLNGTDKRLHKRRKETHASLPRAIAAAPPATSLAAPLLPTPSVLYAQEGKILVTELMTYKGLGYAFNRLQMPSHLVCAIIHDMTAVAILAQGNPLIVAKSMARITDWAISALNEEMNLPASKMAKMLDRPSRSESSHQKTASMLLLLGDFVQRMGACTESLQRWTSRLLHISIWKTFTLEEKEAILGIVETFVPDDWTEYSTTTLDPLKIITSNSSAQEAALLINTLGRMLQKWVRGRKWADICNALDKRDKDVFFGFRRLSPETDYIETISQTVLAAVDLTLSLLIQLPHSFEVMSASIGLFECIFTMPFMGLHPLHLPPRYPLNLLSLTPYGSVSTLSRLFGIMKQILDLHVDMGGEDVAMHEKSSSSKDSDKINEQQRSFTGDAAKDAFNEFSVYLSDLVWRSNAFGVVPGGRTYDLGPPTELINRFSDQCDQRGDQLVRVGSMTHGSVLASLLEAHTNALMGTSEHSVQGPITSFVLESANSNISYNLLRDRHLDWLADRHATGFRDFFHSTISRFQEAQSQYSTRDQSTATDLA